MINKVILVGNLGSNPEMRYTANATAVANLSVATSRNVKNKASGEWLPETEWHRVVVWGKSGEFAGKYLHKGGRVYVEGRLQTRKWTDKSGVERYSTDVIAEVLKDLSPREAAPRPEGFPAPPPPMKYPEDGIGDDVPF